MRDDRWLRTNELNETGCRANCTAPLVTSMYLSNLFTYLERGIAFHLGIVKA
jgi:hypothetical protein